MGAEIGLAWSQGVSLSVSIWVPLSVSFQSQIVWHFGGWSAWAVSPLLPAPIWP